VSQSAEHGAPHSADAGWRLRLERERALIALFDLGRRKGLGLRAARVYAVGVFATYAMVIAVAPAAGRLAAIQSAMHAALVALSWVVGALAALGTARGLAQQADGDALRALALQRGFGAHAVLRARTLSAALRVARLVGIPALLLVGVAVARGQSLAWALVTVPALAVYAAALGLSLALLAHFSAGLSPRHPRALLAALVLGPVLVSQAYPGFPTLPGVFAALLDRLMSVGAVLT
jgi:hypothetical protein